MRESLDFETVLSSATNATVGCVAAHGDDVFGEQLLGSSDWPDFEGDPAFTVPPKPMPELYSLRGDQVCFDVLRIKPLCPPIDITVSVPILRL